MDNDKDDKKPNLLKAPKNFFKAYQDRIDNAVDTNYNRPKKKKTGGLREVDSEK